MRPAAKPFEKMLRVARSVKLYVESLQDHPDPFLVAKYGNEEFHIEVWDERDFEREL